MSFEIKYFNVGRGTYNNHASIDNKARHSYWHPTDNLDVIIGANYFPENFGFTSEDVLVGDVIDIYGADQNAQYFVSNVVSPAFNLSDIVSERKYTFVTNLTGPYAADPQATITLLKTGKQVTVMMPTVNATANSANIITSSAAVGSILVPQDTVQWLVAVDDNGASVLGTLEILGAGHPTDPGKFRWGVGTSLGTFTGLGATGIIRTSVSYFTL